MDGGGEGWNKVSYVPVPGAPANSKALKNRDEGIKANSQMPRIVSMFNVSGEAVG